MFKSREKSTEKEIRFNIHNIIKIKYIYNDIFWLKNQYWFWKKNIKIKKNIHIFLNNWKNEKFETSHFDSFNINI